MWVCVSWILNWKCEEFCNFFMPAGNQKQEPSWASFVLSFVLGHLCGLGPNMSQVLQKRQFSSRQKMAGNCSNAVQCVQHEMHTSTLLSPWKPSPSFSAVPWGLQSNEDTGLGRSKAWQGGGTGRWSRWWLGNRKLKMYQLAHLQSSI